MPNRQNGKEDALRRLDEANKLHAHERELLEQAYQAKEAACERGLAAIDESSSLINSISRKPQSFDVDVRVIEIDASEYRSSSDLRSQERKEFVASSAAAAAALGGGAMLLKDYVKSFIDGKLDDDAKGKYVFILALLIVALVAFFAVKIATRLRSAKRALKAAGEIEEKASELASRRHREDGLTRQITELSALVSASCGKLAGCRGRSFADLAGQEQKDLASLVNMTKSLAKLISC